MANRRINSRARRSRRHINGGNTRRYGNGGPASKRFRYTSSNTVASRNAAAARRSVMESAARDEGPALNPYGRAGYTNGPGGPGQRTPEPNCNCSFNHQPWDDPCPPLGRCPREYPYCNCEYDGCYCYQIHKRGRREFIRWWGYD